MTVADLVEGLREYSDVETCLNAYPANALYDDMKLHLLARAQAEQKIKTAIREICNGNNR